MFPMKNRIRVFCCLPLVLLAAASLRAETDEGTAANCPWSGYWWQHKSGGLTGPLTKYDAVVGSHASQWEKDTHLNGDLPDWFGYCHAWSASAVTEREPREIRTVGQTTFGIGDQKGLLAACHAQDVANTYGQRYQGNPGDDFQDIYPDELWKTLQMYLKQRRVPIVLDLEPGAEVWNYPVYQYRVDYQPSAEGDGWYEGAMTIVCADDNVEPDFVGMQPLTKNYTFRIQFKDGAIVSGSGKWTGLSVTDHPDFAWYPYVAVAENPEVQVAEVSKIVGFAVGGNNPPSPDNPSPDDPPAPPPTPPVNPPDNPPTPPVNPPDPPVDPPKPGPTPDAPQVQDLVSPDELLSAVLNRSSAFKFDITVDKYDGGRYRSGEPVRVVVTSATEKDGYLYLFDVDPQGQVEMIFPLSGQPNQIKKGQEYLIPDQTQSAWFVAGAPGQHDIKAIVTVRPIEFTGFRKLPQQQAQQMQQVQPGQQAPAEVQQQLKAHSPKMLVNPAAARRIRGDLVAGLRKGKPQQQAEATSSKVWPFAQDLCSYFVLPPDGKPGPKQKTKI
jgi:hypothetical protein